MEILKLLLPFILKGSVAGIIMAIGLDATRDDILHVVRRPSMLGRAFLAICVVVPVAAVLVMRVLPLSLAAKAGVILMALSPVPPFMPMQEMKVGARKAYAYGLYATFALLAVIIVPITVAVLNRVYGTQVELSEAVLVKMVLTSVLGPLLIGMVIKAGWPDLAARLGPLISKISLLLLVLAAVVIIVRAFPAIVDMIGNGMVLGIMAIVLIAMVGGYFLGGPDPRDRPALATAAAIRHPGIAMMIANANSPDKRVDAAIMLYLIVTVILLTFFQVVRKHAGPVR